MTKILIADDEPAIAESTAQLLRMAGHEVAIVTKGHQVFEALRRERPLVLLQDARMPDLDLAAHLQAVRADPATASTFVVLFTASTSARKIGERHGCDAALEKPFDAGQLAASMAEWLQRAASRVPRRQ